MKLEKLSKGRFIKTSIIVLVVISIFGVIFINRSKAKYRVTQSIQIVNGTVNYKVPDLNVLAMYKQKVKGNTDDSNYESINNVPTSEHKLNTTKSYCTKPSTNDTKITGNMVYDAGKVSIDITEKGTKCYLYFDIQLSLKEDIIAKHPSTGTPNFSTTSCASGCGEQTNGIYEADDDFGTSYYFRGTIDDNWVKFGKINATGQDIWWRIIRINGNDTIRLIYFGTNSSSSAPTIEDASTTTYKAVYNKNWENQSYVAYRTSSLKSNVDYWYGISNLSAEPQLQHIDTETGFCSDKDIAVSDNNTVRFKPYQRLENYPVEPSLKCSQSNLFTKTGSKGNNQLTNPVGSITADEVVFAGGTGSNPGYYLNTGYDYWTMSPSTFAARLAQVFYVSSLGGLVSERIDTSFATVPVINLKADTQFIGEGTSTDPYVVVI